MPKVDMLNKKCMYCKKGRYMMKASMFATGRMVCPNCFHDLSRYMSKKELASMRQRIRKHKK